MSLLRRLLLVATTATVVGVLVWFGTQVALPKPPPATVEPQPPDGPALTRHLVLVVVDGLRYDIATTEAIMPHFSRAMRQRTSGTLWANAVTMTTPAILSYTAGRPGELDQIVNNETSKPTAYNHLLANAKAAGLRTAATGDHAWFWMFPNAWDLRHPDPWGVSMEVDYNPEIFEAAHAFSRAEPRPNLLVAHFVTPDHQAHVHGVWSEAYHRHLRGFDQALHELLQALPEDTTVIVTSDHGQLDSGTHGTDLPVLRRTPVFAYGPGIAAAARSSERMKQADLAATMARLLAVASPAHSLGHVLARWLDLPAAEQAHVACAELARLERFAAASGCTAETIEQTRQAACEAQDPEQRMAEALAASRRIATLLRKAEPVESLSKWLLLGMAAIGALALGLLWCGKPRAGYLRSWLPAVLAAAALIALGVALTYGTERLPEPWPDRLRVWLTVAANVALLALVVFLRRFARWLDRAAPLAATLTLGALLVSYTKYTQAEVYIVLATASVLLLVPWLRRLVGLDPDRLGRIAKGRVVLALGLVGLLWPLSHQVHTYYPKLLDSPPEMRRAVAVAALVLFAAERLWRRRSELGGARAWAAAVGSALLAIGCLWLRDAHLGKAAVLVWLLLPIAGLLAWRARQRLCAEQLWLGSYVMVSRDQEMFFLIATVVVAEVLGEMIGRLTGAASSDRGRQGRPRHAAVVGMVALLFSLGFVQRLGIQLGLDFPHFDWAAGTFGEAGVSVGRIGVAIITKHALARLALLAAFLQPLGSATRADVVRGLLLAELGRMVTLLGMLFVCRSSFWTAFRVMGDLPHAFIGVVVAALGCAVVLGPAAARTFGRAPRRAEHGVL